MSTIDFPSDEARAETKRQRLAAYLRELAALIEADEVEVEPTAALVVLTGPRTHELICCGYHDDEWGFLGASRTAHFVAQTSGFATIGGNRRGRSDYVPRALHHSNVVDGAFPKSLPGAGGRADG